MANKLMIIGPSANKNYFGGVHNHIKNLSNLEALKNSYIFDPGSINSNVRTSSPAIFKQLIRLRKILIEESIDILFINISIYLTSLLKLLILFRIISGCNIPRTHVFFHGGRFENIRILKYRYFRVIIKYLLDINATFHFLCDEQKNGFEKYFKGFRTALYSNYSKENTIIDRKIENNSYLQLLYVGRIVREKGLYELLDAIELTNRKEDNRVRLNIVGSGPEIEKIKRKAKELNINNIEFKGYLSGDALDEEYKKADVMVIPSYKEAFPYTMIESLRAGLPIIATSTGAMNELLIDGKNGFIVEPKSPESIVTAIHKCIENKTLLSEMSNNCYELFKTRLTNIKAEEYYYSLIMDNSLPDTI